VVKPIVMDALLSAQGNGRHLRVKNAARQSFDAADSLKPRVLNCHGIDAVFESARLEKPNLTRSRQASLLWF
jgi:hypothetical protein